MATKQVTPQFGLCIDWETTGALWGGDSSIDFQGISMGAVVFDTADFSIVETLYLEIKFDDTKYKWTEGAAKIHGLSIEHLAANGLDQADAAIMLGELILKYWGPDGKVMFLGHNPHFDIRFTQQLFKTIDINFAVEEDPKYSAWIKLHHVILDTSAAGFITTGIYKSDLLFEKMGYDDRGEHNALTDALQTVGTCAALRAITMEFFNAAQ